MKYETGYEIAGAGGRAPGRRDEAVRGELTSHV